MSMTRREMLATTAAGGIALSATGLAAAATDTARALPDATETAAMIRRGDISAVEAIDAAIQRAEALQPKLNFMVTPLFERARERAKTQALTGPFAGVPYLVKDMFDIKGVATRWGSRCTQALPPAATTTPYLEALEAAGLNFIGKSALGEFGYLPTTEPLAFGPTRNPWDLSRTPGGSSGGSAAAVAAGIVPFADAADGGGSIRIPASACGLFGLKPSRHRLIPSGLPSTAPFELEVEHALTRSVRDSAALFAATERTGNTTVRPPIGLVKHAGKRRLRVGFLVESIDGHTPDAEVRRGLDETGRLIEALGHHVEPTKWPVDGEAFTNDFNALWVDGVSHVVDIVRRAVGREPDETLLEPFTLGMARMAAKLPAGEVAAATARLRLAAKAYDEWLTLFDVILSPVMLTPPVPIGYIAGDVPFDAMVERIPRFGGYTTMHNLAGAPAMSVPLHCTTGNLPVGMQFAAGVGQEQTLLELAFALEAARPWAHRRPPIFA